MSLVKYGTYNFPNPQPFVAVDYSPVYVAGSVDHYTNKITLIGTLTGSNLSSLTSGKRGLTTGLSNQYLSLEIGAKTFSCTKVAGISFDESELNTVLPYSVELEVYQDTDFSEYFGVTEPQNSWSYQEQQGRIIGATHKVSAVGVKTGLSDPLDYAISFVNARVTGFENISCFLSGQSGFLVSKTEEINRQKKSYSISEEYSFTNSSNYISNSGLVTASSQVSYSKDNGLQVSVNGLIQGAVGGIMVTTGIFTPQHAQNLATEAVINSKSDFESGVYGYLVNGPSSYSYDVDEFANTIGFDFQFKDPDRFSNFRNAVSVSVSSSKDNSNVVVNVNGELTKKSNISIFNGTLVEDNITFQELQEEFSGINPYGFALQGYQDFCDEFSIYDDGTYLSPKPISESITKNPFAPSISYEYSYDNTLNLSENLQNLSISATDNKPMLVNLVQESVHGFSIQEDLYRKLGTLSVQASCDSNSGNLNELKEYVEDIFTAREKVCEFTSKSNSVGGGKVSYSFNSIYR